MEGLTAKEMAERLKLSMNAVKVRLYRAGIKPKGYCGMTALYDEAAFNAIKQSRGPGRPPRDPQEGRR